MNGNEDFWKLNRRRLLGLASTASLASLLPRPSFAGNDLTPTGLNETTRPDRRLVRLSEKTSLIQLADRPPQLETPLHYFRQDLTPNEAFFVRWHLSGYPTHVDTRTFRLRLDGQVARPQSFSLQDLVNDFEPVTLVAMNQCSGNARSLFSGPTPAGLQWQFGGMGNAQWTGVRLKDLLDRAGARAGAVEVAFSGLDESPMPGLPKIVKSLKFDHANAGDVMVAYAMNGAALPMLNGFPLRLVVPGWYATYWIKSLAHIEVLDKRLSNIWMDEAYRIPDNPEISEEPGKLAARTVPINRFATHSIFVRPEPEEALLVNHPYMLEGLANDGGDGIARVEVSLDGGRTWTDAKLDPEIGRYSWRRWRFIWTPTQKGRYALKVRATNRAGEGQLTSQWNRGGLARRVIEQTTGMVI
ncbi:molybdopterin-dependent oxidoreductase [Pseudomonas sp. ZS1P83]